MKTALALVFALLCVSPDAYARTSRRVCRAACQTALGECITSGQRLRACKRVTLRTCRRIGVTACIPITTTTLASDTTTTLPTTQSTTTTVTTGPTVTTSTTLGPFSFVGTWQLVATERTTAETIAGTVTITTRPPPDTALDVVCDFPGRGSVTLRGVLRLADSTGRLALIAQTHYDISGGSRAFELDAYEVSHNLATATFSQATYYPTQTILLVYGGTMTR